MGQSASVKLPGNANALEGHFASIDTRGYMLLETPDGEKHVISAGEIFFGDNKQQG